jgi:hypothetical protein
VSLLKDELDARLRSAREAFHRMEASAGNRKHLQLHFVACLTDLGEIVGPVVDRMVQSGRGKDVADAWKNAVLPWVRREFNPDASEKMSCIARIRNRKQKRPPIIADDEETLSHFAKHYWDKLYLLDEIWPDFKKRTVTDPIGRISYDLFDLCKTVIQVSEKLIAEDRNTE